MLDKRYIVILLGIAAMFAGCHSPPAPAPAPATPTDPVGELIRDFRRSVSEDAIVGIGVASPSGRNLAERRALEEISRQLSHIVSHIVDGENLSASTYVRWFCGIIRKTYDIQIFASASISSARFSSWARDNNILRNAQRYEVIGSELIFMVAYVVPGQALLSFPRVIMPVTTLFTIEQAVQSAATNISSRLLAGSTIAIINIYSVDPDLAEFVLEELSTELVRLSRVSGRGYYLVDRRRLDVIRSERDFQLSGDVSDETIVSIGQFLGADVVITGSITGANEFRRLRVKALDVETARLLVQTNLKY